MKLYRRLLGYVRPYRAVFAGCVVGMVLVASTDLMMLRVVQPLLNNFGALRERAWNRGTRSRPSGSRAVRSGALPRSCPDG